MVRRSYHPPVPPASPQAEALSRRLRGPGLRWRGSSPVLSAITRDLQARAVTAVTETVPAPAPEKGES